MKYALLIALVICVYACGSPAPVESETLPPASDADALVQRECGRCHDGRKESPKLQSQAQLKAARAGRLIESGRMPPDRRLAADVKARLVSLAE